MKPFFVLLLCLMLMSAGCLKARLDEWVGKPFREMLEAKGRPDDFVVVDDNLTIYEFQRQTQQYINGQVVPSSCVVNINVDGQGIITGYNYRGRC